MLKTHREVITIAKRIIKGTTACLVIKLQKEYENVSDVIFFLKSGDYTIKKKYPGDTSVTYVDGVYKVGYTQAETIRLDEKVFARLQAQINFNNLNVAKTEEMHIRIVDTVGTDIIGDVSGSMDDEVITLNADSVIYGADGKSAYEIAVEHGFTGTEEEWLASLRSDSLEAVEKLEVKIRDNYYTKNEVNALTIGVVTPTGVVNSVSDLKEVASPQVGDIYRVDDANRNYGFDGANWQPVVTNAEILNRLSPLEDSTTWGTFTKG